MATATITEPTGQTELPLETSQVELERIFQSQREAFAEAPMPDRQYRIDRLNALKKVILKYQDEICDAVSNDFGHRSKMDTLISDVLPSVVSIKYANKRIKKWMRPQKRSAGMALSPAKLTVNYQPKGVIGVVVPWNFPIYLAMGPLIGALAAGNRVMIKMSEKTPAIGAVTKKMLGEIFDDNEVAVVLGEVEIARAFTSLPFDHLLFTGSTDVGRHVMKAAAENLTPVTLELGGKSPLIVGPDIDVKTAATRMMFGKCVNAAQVCVAPDYAFVPRAKVDAFVDACREQFNQFYPDGLSSKDYTSVVNSDQYSRLVRMLDDAESRGAKVVPACENPRDDEHHRMATHFLTNVTDEMEVMKEEIFGPLLPVFPYDKVEDAYTAIRSRPRPLALYLMSFDNELANRTINQTHAGGMSINETILHVAADDAPFGGIGESGMGHYHGHEGFLTFSHAKTVFKRGRFDAAEKLRPPYGTSIQKLVLKLFLR